MWYIDLCLVLDDPSNDSTERFGSKFVCFKHWLGTGTQICRHNFYQKFYASTWTHIPANALLSCVIWLKFQAFSKRITCPSAMGYSHVNSQKSSVKLMLWVFYCTHSTSSDTNCMQVDYNVWYWSEGFFFPSAVS